MLLLKVERQTPVMYVTAAAASDDPNSRSHCSVFKLVNAGLVTLKMIVLSFDPEGTSTTVACKYSIHAVSRSTSVCQHTHSQ